MENKECAFDKHRICDEGCIAFQKWITKDCAQLPWQNIKCRRGNFMIKEQGD